MSVDLTDDMSTLVQVMAWCRQATSHYLSQSCPTSLSSYGVNRPQLVKEKNINFLIMIPFGSIRPSINGCYLPPEESGTFGDV